MKYLHELENRPGKDSRIKREKIRSYLQTLSRYGTKAGMPYLKHVDGAIWELRPLRDRIFFVAWYKSNYVLLHAFVKKTQKTPKREIEQAQREYADLLERGLDHE